MVGTERRTHRSDNSLAVNSDDLLADTVHVEDSSLGVVDDGGSEHGTEDTRVADGEAAALHILHGKLTIASLHGLALLQ